VFLGYFWLSRLKPKNQKKPIKNEKKQISNLKQEGWLSPTKRASAAKIN